MYQDILAALLNGTLTAEGLREVTEVAISMQKLGITLGGPIVVSKEAQEAAACVEGSCNVHKNELPAVLEKFKEKNKEMGKSIGNKIQIIKLLREQLGLGLADAKHVSERLYNI